MDEFRAAACVAEASRVASEPVILRPGLIHTVKLYERKSPAAGGANFLSGRMGGLRVLVLPNRAGPAGRPPDPWASIFIERWIEHREQLDPFTRGK